MAWIKFEKDLLTDPRVVRIARSLEARWKLSEVVCGSKEFEICNAQALPAVTLVCGALVRIWSLADTHVGSDDVLPLGKAELDDVIGILGFCSLLPEDWLEEVDEHSVKLPHFHAHNGTEAKKKAVTQKRVARHRQALHDRNASALPDQDQTKTRPDYKKTKEEEAPQRSRGSRLPADWQPSEILKAWASKERPDLSIEKTIETFRDYWHSKPGASATKLDWDKTFKNWVRGEKQGNSSKPIDYDALAKRIEEEDRQRAGV